MDKRQDATNALIDSLKTRFPKRGFKVHPAVNFCFSQNGGGGGGGGGMIVVAKEPIAKDDILLVIPESIRCSVSSVLSKKEHKGNDQKIASKMYTLGSNV